MDVEKYIQASAICRGFLFFRSPLVGANTPDSPMNKCHAFQPIAGTRKGWIPCARRAEEGALYCRKHGDAVFGAMLGALVYQEPVKTVERLGEDPGALGGNKVEMESPQGRNSS
ncbi:MAG: hypothetical protein WBR26_03305 [Candidatus Acidiferrum sp.]